MSSFDRFRQRNKDRSTAQSNFNSKFTFAGYPSIEIKDRKGNQQIAAVVNKQEKDSAYVYTKIDEPLEIGSVWEAKGLHMLISEEIVIIKNVNWKKYTAILCNIEVDGVWGYFKGPEKSYISVTLRDDAPIQSLQKPILILPKDVLGFEDKIVIGGRGWLVQEYDNMSSPGLIYYSLRQTTISKEVSKENEGKDVYIERKEEIVNNVSDENIIQGDTPQIMRRMAAPIIPITYIYPIDEISISTENNYFKSSSKEIIIKQRLKDKIIFSIPFGINEVEIETKEDGEVVKHIYRQKD